MQTIKINNIEYPIRFGLSIIKRFSLSQGWATVNEFDEWVSKANYNAFDTIDKFAQLFLIAIKRASEIENIECNLVSDDILDMIFETPNEFSKMQKILEDSMAEFGVKNEKVAEGEAEKKLSAGRT